MRAPSADKSDEHRQVTIKKKIENPRVLTSPDTRPLNTTLTICWENNPQMELSHILTIERNFSTSISTTTFGIGKPTICSRVWRCTRCAVLYITPLPDFVDDLRHKGYPQSVPPCDFVRAPVVCSAQLHRFPLFDLSVPCNGKHAMVGKSAFAERQVDGNSASQSDSPVRRDHPDGRGSWRFELAWS